MWPRNWKPCIGTGLVTCWYSIQGVLSNVCKQGSYTLETGDFGSQWPTDITWIKGTGEVMTEKLNSPERNTSKREFVHHKSHTDWPKELTPELRNRKTATNCPKCWPTSKLHTEKKKNVQPWRRTHTASKSYLSISLLLSRTVFRQFTRYSKREPNLAGWKTETETKYI